MQSTRQGILEILKEQNLATVEQLSESLELTPVTIRHHLDILRGEGLVDVPQMLRRLGPGRPQHAYRLTEEASDYFPKNYHDLINFILDEIQDRVTPTEMEQIMNGVARRMAAQAPSHRRAQSPQAVLDATVRFLNDKGYLARWEKTSQGDYLLHTCNCPYERVAEAHNQVCAMDVSFVAELVGAPVQRILHLATGDESCTYQFRFDDR